MAALPAMLHKYKIYRYTNTKLLSPDYGYSATGITKKTNAHENTKQREKKTILKYGKCIGDNANVKRGLISKFEAIYCNLHLTLLLGLKLKNNSQS